MIDDQVSISNAQAQSIVLNALSIVFNVLSIYSNQRANIFYKAVRLHSTNLLSLSTALINTVNKMY